MAEKLELKAEQDYLIRVRESLNSSVAALRSTADAVADNKAQRMAHKKADRAEQDAAKAFETGVFFGRYVLADGHRTAAGPEGRVYIGRLGVSDESDFPLVVNWRAPVANLYYEASHEDPKNVLSRRAYTYKGNNLVDFDEVVFESLSKRVAGLLEPEVDDALLADLKRLRSGSLQDIVKTIQAAQHKLIRADRKQLLVVQGGPGTGKTVLALHRVSWLLYNDPTLSADKVLVVGPNPTFVRYIKELLPALGDRDVQHSSLNRLGAGTATIGRAESPGLAQIKGQDRMKRMLKRGLVDRIGVPVKPVSANSEPSDKNSSAPIDPLTMVEGDALNAAIDRFRLGPSYSAGRSALRNYLRGAFAGRVDEARIADITDRTLERIWPQLRSASFLQDMFGSEARLLRAAGDDFTANEVQALYRRATDRLTEETWSDADVALLDYADYLISGSVARFEHIVVDEAQDLSPMQLGSIARRSPSGSMTVLGDLAQSTGPWARDTWDEVVEILRGDAPSDIAELEIGYRVPKEAFSLAAELLPIVAPGIKAPRIVRSGTTPEILPAPNNALRAKAVVERARDYASRGEMVGIICPDAARESVVKELERSQVNWRDASAGDLGGGVNLVDPHGAKGLEFDAVVLVEPELIVASDERGGRLLYVALTRTTSHLAIVHTGDPFPLTGTETESTTVPDEDPAQDHRLESPEVDETEVPRAVKVIAASIAAEIRETLREEQIPLLLRALEKELNGRPDGK
jgi:DNA helicase IV